MSYRDDRDADQARIASLERELAETRDKLAALESRRAHAYVVAIRGALAPGVAPSTAARVFGLGTLQLFCRFDGAFPAARFEHLDERIRELTGDPGRTELRGRAEGPGGSVNWFNSPGDRSTVPYRIAVVAVRGGVTTLVVTDRLSGLAGAIYGGVGGGAGGVGLSLPIMVSTFVPMLAPVILLGWLGGVFFGTRALYLRLARRRAAELQQVFDALVDDIERALRGDPVTGA